MEPEENLESGKSTGPITEAGKAVSSMNRLTHGCRSAQIILHNEDPAEYASLIQGWFKQYNPQNPAERVLVEQTAHAQWYLQRNQRRFDEVDHAKNLFFRTWTENQHKEYALALRYKTSAERAFLRWFKELESYYARAERNRRRETQSIPVKPFQKPPEPRKQAIYPALLPNSPAPSEFFFPSESSPSPSVGLPEKSS